MKHLVIACLLLATCPAVADASGATVDVRSVDIGSEPDNSPPLPTDDHTSTLWETAVEIPIAGLLSNDVDPDGDPLRVVGFGQPVHGTLTLSSGGRITYVPPSGCAVGRDSFGYVVSDGRARAPATVYVDIGGIVCPAKPPNQ